MAYNRFNLVLYVRLILTVVLALTGGYLIHNGSAWVATAIIMLLILLSVIWLVKFINTTNQEISYFIQAIKNDDTTLRFPENVGNSNINKVHNSLNELNLLLQNIKVESQVKERYFSKILQNIATGVMVVNAKGFVTDVNIAVLDLLGLHHLTHVSQLNRVDAKFKSELDNIENHQKQVLKLNRKNEKLQVIVRCSVINVKKEDIKLITIQDIRGELERKEIDSWVKLIRVLSHEIMNTLAPVTSIAQVLKGIWQDKIKQDKSISQDEDIKNTIGGLDVIGDRGEALIRFVQSYRMLAKAPEPNYSEIHANHFIDRLKILISPLKEEFNGVVSYAPLSEDFSFHADEQMVVQVVINLVKNAIEAALSVPSPTVKISCKKQKEWVEIAITDNGSGIADDMLEEIFIPFFTTKENGSGIGLSLSRQIMRLHGGTLKVHSSPKTGSVFTMVFPVA